MGRVGYCEEGSSLLDDGAKTNFQDRHKHLYGRKIAHGGGWGGGGREKNFIMNVLRDVIQTVSNQVIAGII